MTTPDTGPSAAKAAARAEARGRRRQGPPPDAQSLARQALAFVHAIPGPPRVTCYASYGTEPPTATLITLLMASGFDVLLPRVLGDDLAWGLADQASALSAMGIAEPVGAPVELLPVRAMLIPALAVTPSGDRLGKGGGYYDRTIADLGDAVPVIAAIVGDGDIVDGIPVEEHDRRVDAIITPTRVIECVPR